MPKIRVYEIAKELNIPSKELIDLLKTNNIDVKSHANTVDEDETKRIVSRHRGNTAGAVKSQSSDMGHASTENQPPQKPAGADGSLRPTTSASDNNTDRNRNENQNRDTQRPRQPEQRDNRPANNYTKKPNSFNNQNREAGGEQTANRQNNNRPGNQPRYGNKPNSERPPNAPQGQRNQSSFSRDSGRPDRPAQRTDRQGGQTPQRDRPPGAPQSNNPARPQGSQPPQRTGSYSNSQGPRRDSQSGGERRPGGSPGYGNQQPRRDSSGSGSQQSQRPPARTPQPTQGSRSEIERPKNFTQQKPGTDKKSTVGQKTGHPQRDFNGTRGQSNQKSSDRFQMLSAQKPAAPKKRPSKKVRAAKAAEAELAAAAAQQPETEISSGIIHLPKMITVKDLAEKMGKETSEVIKALMKRGIMANLNQEIDYYNASLVAEDFELLVDKEEEVDLLEVAFSEEEIDNPEDMAERSPVVVVMGHVDHGKTSLLDRIRKTSVTVSEAGGITQHIGAYTVNVSGKSVTFLDTPGHEAFTAMRMRGAQVTDIAVLVVAADDGVMPQTIEAINHAKAANVEIIVAINKVDKPGSNPDRVKQELADHGLLSESWGGETICVEVSAITGDGIDNLLEMITVVAEMKELRANAKKSARGTVIEALLDKGRGPVATVLVQSGTLSIGDPVVAGATFGKIRAMSDDKGHKLKTAGPSMPVEILGLSEVPLAGDMFYVSKNEKHARVLSESVRAKGRENLMKSMPKVSLDGLFDQIQSGNVKELNLVIKADVQGSVEAVRNSLERLSGSEVRIRAIHGGVGAITESDVMLASASNAIIIGFNVRPEAPAKSVADTENVDIRLYRIIYNAIEDITAAMKGLLDPVFKEKVIGHAEIRQLFKASNIGTIAGSYITDGKFTRNSKVRIIRNSKVVYDGTLDTLKRFKDDVKEVNSGYECGLLFNKYNDIKEGDKVEAYIMEEVPR